MTNVPLTAPIASLFVSSGGSSNTLSGVTITSGTNVSNQSVNAMNYSNTATLGNNSINYGPGGGSGGGSNAVVNTIGYSHTPYQGYYWGFLEPYQRYYHSCYPVHVLPTADKFETAWKLSRKLMDKKMVKPMKTVEDFFKLMDSIVEIL